MLLLLLLFLNTVLTVTSVDFVEVQNTLALFSFTGHKAVMADVLYTQRANVVPARGLIKDKKIPWS